MRDTIENIRLVATSCLSYAFGWLMPTKGFVLALVLTFAFNCWAGMRADGVSIARCRNFSMGKFKNALVEILLYLVIIEIVFSIMTSCGDSKAALVTAKSMTYVFIYVYLQNSFKNLVKAYPRKMALRVIYHLLRFEFTRALPSYLKPIIERVEGEIEKNEKLTIKNEKSKCDEDGTADKEK